ncbi:hypothetical protein [Amycolatopsis sp. 3B14]|uniref:MmyB family transcriptional regulator n=1 Tax=Amycolatopsis sp. 3B14 TaxID=3243600 RepID=UPI003D96602B
MPSEHPRASRTAPADAGVRDVRGVRGPGLEQSRGGTGRADAHETFRHPAVGEITLDCDTLTLTDRDQHLVLYSAPRGSRDINASKPL